MKCITEVYDRLFISVVASLYAVAFPKEQLAIRPAKRLSLAFGKGKG